MMTKPLVLRAKWIFPIGQEPLENGALVIDGDRIADLLPSSRVNAKIDFGDAALLPGLVNAHTHLDLSDAENLPKPTQDPLQWLRAVVAHRRQQTPEGEVTAIDRGIQECLRFGTTLVGDITGNGTSWGPLTESPLRAVVFRELIGLPKDRAEQSWQRAQTWLGAAQATAACRPALSPHAPYSARVSLIKAAAQSGLPLAIHLAEFEHERALLEEHSGPFVEFLKEFGAWDPLGLAKGPEHVLRLIAGNQPALCIHGNYLSLNAPIPDNLSLVHCPRTHAAFGHPPFPLQHWIDRGVNVAIGTDSLASNPDLSVLEEMREVRRWHPDIPGDVILQLGTSNGARALGLDRECGSLEQGMTADFVVVPIDDAAQDCRDVYDLILQSENAVGQTWIAGQRVH